MPENMLIFHGGGPTAVLNSSLYGAVAEAKKHGGIGHIYGAIGGTGGFIKGNRLDFRQTPERELALLRATPGSAIGTSRDTLRDAEYEKIVDELVRQDIKFVLCNGGNGTMDTCGKIYERCRDKGILVMGIPKTVDNDIAITDHTPGYGSAARFIATTAAEIAADVRSLPIHIVVLEAMGRNAGWIAAASALANEGPGGPDLIYLPERPFCEDEFLQDVQKLIDTKRGALVVASEGLADKAGEPIAEPIFSVGRSTYYNDVSTRLVQLIIQKLGYKARGEKPGLAGRTSMGCVSGTDRDEAALAGAAAVKAVLEGESGKMVGFRRVGNDPYQVETFLIPVGEVMLNERKMPEDFISARGNNVTGAFCDWCRPLIGGPLPEMACFQ